MSDEKKERTETKPEEHPVFHYTVDDEPQTTDKHVLTPKDILEKADLNPTTYYLVQIMGSEKVSYKDKYGEQIHIHQHMTFISVFIGDTPVS